MERVADLTIEAFEALLEKHIDAKITTLKDELHLMFNSKFESLEQRITNLEHRFTQVESRVNNLEAYMTASEQRLATAINNLGAIFGEHMRTHHTGAVN